MYDPVLDPNQPNCLLLRYKAADANLVRDSVALFWRSRPDQPWQPIASAFPANDGEGRGRMRLDDHAGRPE